MTMETAISDMVAANGGTDIEQTEDGDRSASNPHNTAHRAQSVGNKAGYGDDRRPGRAQRRRDAIMRERNHNRDIVS